MNSVKKEVHADPDYELMQEESVSEVNESLQHEDARDNAIHTMRSIIHEQFSFEISLKEKEVATLNHRVHECRTSLDRLRACVLAGYYGYGTTPASVRQKRFGTGKSGTTLKESNLSSIMNWKHSLPSNLKEQEPDQNLSSQSQNMTSQSQINKNLSRTSNPIPRHGKIGELPSLDGCNKTDSVAANESRFYVKRRIIIGNTSKYIMPDQRERNDRSTHKWMVYVRGAKDDEGLENFINKVWFLLHPSYQPNDLIELCKPPFQVTRRGWGEFPVRVQLHFVENKNKRVDIIHHLKLDKTYTGLQTLGSETHVEIELDRKNFDGLNQYSSRMGTDVVQRTCSELENTKPVSSTSFDLSSEKHEITMYSDTTAVNKKGTKRGCKSKDDVLADHSYSITASETISSQDEMKNLTLEGSNCSSPKRDQAAFQESFSGESNFQQELLLQKCVQMFPVVRPEKCLSKPGYCASSQQAFLGWNLGKRLAAEWQRALAIKTHIKNDNSIMFDISEESQIKTEKEGQAITEHNSSTSSMKTHCHPEDSTLSLSTKDVMNYCRMHGYTPMLGSPTEGRMLCKFCGEEIGESDVDENDQPLLAHKGCVSEFEEDDMHVTAKEFLESLSKSQCLPREHYNSPDNDYNEVVDVVTITRERLHKDPFKTRLFFLPTTAEHEWIQEIASEVDVELTNFDIDSVRAPVTSAMLYKACTMFAEEIVRKANRFTWKSSLKLPKAKCILPYHVKQALEAIPHCDFLTSKYLYVEIAPDKD